jgi:hypothetical protein
MKIAACDVQQAASLLWSAAIGAVAKSAASWQLAVHFAEESL